MLSPTGLEIFVQELLSELKIYGSSQGLWHKPTSELIIPHWQATTVVSPPTQHLIWWSYTLPQVFLTSRNHLNLTSIFHMSNFWIVSNKSKPIFQLRSQPACSSTTATLPLLFWGADNSAAQFSWPGLHPPSNESNTDLGILAIFPSNNKNFVTSFQELSCCAFLPAVLTDA